MSCFIRGTIGFHPCELSNYVLLLFYANYLDNLMVLQKGWLLITLFIYIIMHVVYLYYNARVNLCKQSIRFHNLLSTPFNLFIAHILLVKDFLRNKMSLFCCKRLLRKEALKIDFILSTNILFYRFFS